MELLPYKIYKRFLLLAGALFFFHGASAQTATQNYVRTRVPRTGITTNARLDQLTPVKDSVMTAIQYIDGLGRPMQAVQQRASPVGYDIIQPVAYDQYGREAVKYLPYVNTSTSYGAYRSDALNTGAGVRYYYNPSGGTTEGQQTNGVVKTLYPFAQTSFEPSPLNRVVEQGAPGLAWQTNGVPDTAHALRIAFATNEQTSIFSTTNITGTNTGSRKAALYSATVNSNNSRSLIRTGNTATYTPGQLTVTINKDENWKTADGCFGTAEEYKDKEGHVVLKRTYNIKGAVAEMLSTYYVYDILGNLCFVVPPGAKPDSTAAISQSTIDNRCYQYRYDSRNRLTQKKVPGKGWEFIIYNKLDQPIATQDSVQRMKVTQEWTITKYDAMGRPVITGIFQNGGSGADNHVAVQALADTATKYWETRQATGSTGYTSVAWPGTYATTLSVTYYDTYTNIPSFPSLYNQQSNTLYSKKTTGLVTATKVLVLNTTGDYLWTVPYYDEDGQVIRTFSQHYLGGASWLNQYNYDDEQIKYNFNKQPLTVVRYHYNKNAAGSGQVLIVTATNEYTYDHMGRKLLSKSNLQNGTDTTGYRAIVSKSIYNELGQLKQKGLHSLNGTSFLQNVDYRYNARGWLTNINNPTLTADGGLTNADTNDQFGMELKYNNAPVPQYNGNIGKIKTLTGALSGTTYSALTYNYRYDKLNRLVNAISSTATETANDNFYNENVTYDVMGNITKLNRYDKPTTTRTAIDSLTYTYVSGNKVDRIDDAVVGGTTGFIEAVKQPGEYTYDGNGNQLNDLNKGLTQTYNMLKLPQTAVKGSTSVAYVYDATGRKLRKLSTTLGTTTVTEYIAGIQYQYSTTTPALDFISTEEGRARKSGTAYKYEYDLKDHLGNTRMTTTWNPSDATQMTPLNSQRSDYYAFGYTIQSLVGTTPSSANHYLYNHKELQDETGLYDYGARFYDPVIGRWTTVDPLAEQSRRHSPYNYGLNNPVRNIDPDGMAAWHPDGNGNLVADEGDNATTLSDYLKIDISSAQNLISNLSNWNDGNSMSTGIGDIAGNYLSAHTSLGGYATIMSQIFYVNPDPPDEIHAYDPFGGAPVNYQDIGDPRTSLAIGQSTLDTYGAVSGVSEMTGAIRAWSAARGVESVGGTLDGSFSVSNWNGYPTAGGGFKPSGPFQLLEGADYQAARTLANQTNAALRDANPELLKGYQIHEIQPVKFGGSPTNLSNKILLTPAEHAQYTNYWNAMMRSINKP
jgi:RHS repeat-associated protein